MTNRVNLIEIGILQVSANSHAHFPSEDLRFHYWEKAFEAFKMQILDYVHLHLGRMEKP